MRFLKARGKANSLKKHFIHVSLSVCYKITKAVRALAVVGQTTVVYYAGQRQLENDKKKVFNKSNKTYFSLGLRV